MGEIHIWLEVGKKVSLGKKCIVKLWREGDHSYYAIKKCKEMVNYKEVGKTGSEVYACRKWDNLNLTPVSTSSFGWGLGEGGGGGH